MAGYSAYLILCSMLSPFVALGQSDQNLLPDRDEWYKLPRTYTNLVRVFNLNNGCPAEKFYLDCNTCSCEDGSNPQCTIMLCPPKPQIVNWGEPGTKCPAEKPFFWKCNDCICDKSGEGAVCTKKYCPDFTSDE
ncbi:hypothetical protein QAD02_023851 [Eretmocerus hayati]|uniref:Uncharacterized protein n=1 Tax=Eretmocerus hayati TaxID=131215 RepID=A0ACC2PWZ7_9HYME|nr:hypothetical protein QAD02_023851 [Eretmocerus hayati]